MGQDQVNSFNKCIIKYELFEKKTKLLCIIKMIL